MEIKAKREKFRAAGKVAASVNLARIYLRRIVVSNEVQLSLRKDARLSVAISHRCVEWKLIEPETLFVEIEATVKLEHEGSDNNGDSNLTLATAKVAYGVEYAMPSDPIPKEIEEGGFEAFAELNALLNCWPYLRGEIQRLTAAMDLPVTLPTLRIVPEEEPQSTKPRKKRASTTKKAKKPGRSRAKASLKEG